jgi:hypothetical protein
MKFLDRLSLTITAAERTPEQKEKDRLSLQDALKKKEDEKDRLRTEEGRKPQQYRKEAGKKPSASKLAEKLKAMPKPLSLLLLNAKASLTENGYQSFLNPEKKDLAQSIKNSVLLSDTGAEVYGWLCSKEDIGLLEDEADFLGIPRQTVGLPNDFLDQDAPFEGMKITLEDAGDAGRIKLDLDKAWKPIAASLKGAEEKKPDENKLDEKEPEETPKEGEEDQENEDTQEENPEEQDDAEDISGYREGATINPGRFRSLKTPYILILDPRKRYADFVNFLGPDEEGAPQKASQVLPNAIKMLASKKLKSPEGAPVLVYILDGKQAADLKIELKRESRPHFKLSDIDKALFDKDEPFEKLSLGGEQVDPVLVAEMNQAWLEATSQASGNPVPAVQANTLVPLNFFRLLGKHQRPVQLHLGNQPAGSGSEDTIYVLASEAEAEKFLATVRKFKMPSLFYERMSANSDIDAGFKRTDPKEFVPANVLILTGRFKPGQPVEVTDHNRELAETYPEAKAALEKLDKLKKQKDGLKGKEDPALDAEIEKQSELAQVDQLSMLHAYARLKLGNRTRVAGKFIKGSVSIGTHIASFNAGMTVCFLWGSLVKHVTVDPKEAARQLPFADTVVTSYL